MKIYLTSVSPHQKMQCEKLTALWKLSSQRHHLALHPADADIIILTDIKGPNWFEDLRRNPLIQNPKICFVISDADYPLPLLHGIYISNQTSLFFNSRFRTGCYGLYPDHLQNQFIKNSSGHSYLHTKKFLYSFIGQDSSDIRRKLFKHRPTREDTFIFNSTKDFNLYASQGSHSQDHWQLYYDGIVRSKFVLCPKGTSPASLRLFEVMKMGVAPVIISDQWILPQGPTWSEFALFIKEKDISELDALLTEKEDDYRVMGKKAQNAYEQFFADNVYFDYLVDQLTSIMNHQKIPEMIFWSFRNLMVRLWILKRIWKKC